MKTVSMKRKIGIAVAALLAIVLYVAFAIPKPEVTKADTSIHSLHAKWNWNGRNAGGIC